MSPVLFRILNTNLNFVMKCFWNITFWWWWDPIDTRRNLIIQGIHKRMVRFLKLIRHLFLTLHGQNTHRQQRQLSKFPMRYQQFASHTYCGAAGSVSKTAPQREKAFCVLRFEVSRSDIVIFAMHDASFLKLARDSRCTVITDLDVSKRSTQKAFSCCDAILETGPAAPQ